MNFNTIIGVCIPTYKRPEQLIQCVRSIIVAAKPYNVPIFITDDSTDDTNNDTLSQLCKEYEHIIYINNEQNLGIDKNILKCIDVCTCKYAWPIGEDDRIAPDAIEKVLGVLETHSNNIPFIFANYVYVNNEVTHITSEKRINIDADMEMGTTEFFEKYAWTIGFIGACIINKSLWSNIDSSKYVGTYFAHVGTILEYIFGEYVYVSSDIYVLNRAEDSTTFTWAEYSFDVNFGWDDMVSRLQQIYGVNSCKNAIESSRIIFNHNTIRYLCSKRADGVYNLKNFNTYVLKSDPSIVYKLSAYIVAIIPTSLFKLIKYIYMKKKKHTFRNNMSLISPNTSK